MKQTKLIMGMPITVEIASDYSPQNLFDEVFTYFKKVDDKYSTYKKHSEVSKINRGLPKDDWSEEMKQVMLLCEHTRQQTRGYFDINREGQIDPSGLVKGWAIENAAKILRAKSVKNFYIDAGGDIQASGHNGEGNPWSVGIRNPFNRTEIIKVVSVNDEGIATSGTAVRGKHIYDPFSECPAEDIVSLTVIGPNIYDADRFTTAAFAMGKKGIDFIHSLGYEAYMVTAEKKAIFTEGFERYVKAEA